MNGRDEARPVSRRSVLRAGMCGGALAGVGALGLLLGVGRGRGGERIARRGNSVWQLDPNQCVQCGNCATYCVLETSAVKCVHSYAMCGYCDLCTGYFEPDPNALNTAAENQLCPTGAIERTYIEDPYYEYTIDESLCIGCGKCVKGCATHGNGSLFLQVRHDLCLNCGQCTIASACPAGAFKRVSAEHPYLLKDKEPEA